jgi:precorrin-2 dehydrogenase / sirohydrochlorin ferrochelatase
MVLDGARIRAVVVGGGAVACRKAKGLLDSGASVRVIAPEVAPPLRALHHEQLRIIERAYQDGDIGDATLVIAATNVRGVNARVAADARAAGRLVNVSDAPAEGDWVTVATHRAGPMVIGVSAGGVPSAAVRIRDAIAARFDSRYGDALAALARLRQRGSEWTTAEGALIGPDFCEQVERGEIAALVAAWP